MQDWLKKNKPKTDSHKIISLKRSGKPLDPGYIHPHRIQISMSAMKER